MGENWRFKFVELERPPVGVVAPLSVLCLDAEEGVENTAASRLSRGQWQPDGSVDV